MVRQLHDDRMARVTDNGAVSEAFAVASGVKQGRVLAPTHFSLMSSAMLMDAYRDERPGIRIAYRTDGHLLNQRRMHFPSREPSPISPYFPSSLPPPPPPLPPLFNYQQVYPCSDSPSIPMFENYIPPPLGLILSLLLLTPHTSITLN
nr:unnamed protein product [Spirometra erinaceieuropaei]